MSDGEQERYKEQIVALLKEMLKWVKATSFPKVGELLSNNLKSDEEKLAYHFSDGRTSREVASLSGAGQSTIVGWWKKWSKLGLTELISVQRGERGKRVFSLGDFGIEIPKTKEAVAPGEALEERTEQQVDQDNP